MIPAVKFVPSGAKAVHPANPRHTMNLLTHSLALAVTSFALTTIVSAEEKPPAGGGGAKPEAAAPPRAERPAKPEPAESKVVVTEHTANIGGKPIAYKVTTGYLV